MRRRLTISLFPLTFTEPSRRLVMKRPLSSWKVFSNLQQPTEHDVKELLIRMNSRPGSVLTNTVPNHNSTSSSLSLDKYNIDWTKKYRGQSSVVVVRPKSTQEVAAILQYCYTRRLPVVPQGGNTGLVGGSVPVQHEIIMSMEQMNTIYDNGSSSSSTSNNNNNNNNNILRADAGCILQDLQDHVAKYRNGLVPVDLGARGTCQIGGNLATNAGGVYYYRYGSLHANCLGLQVVDGTGRILNLQYDPLSHLKDNTGYHLKHLFIGAEGTLGVITKVALWCPPLPTSIGAVWLTCRSLLDVNHILKLVKTQYLTEILAAFEFMDHHVLEWVQEKYRSNLKLPCHIANDSTTTNGTDGYSILIETHGSNEEHDRDKLSALLEHIVQQNLVIDGVVAQNVGQVQEFWKVRDICNPAAAATGCNYKYDVSLAADDFDNFIRGIKSKLQFIPRSISIQSSSSIDLQCVNWGHIIDGNLHCNVVSVGNFERDTQLMEYLDQCILAAVLKRNGSISAEHGLGQYKNKYMSKIKDPVTLQAMKQIKTLFDPHGIMNPGKLLPND
jgi:FAD/FMN-containing dehydrogenase